MHTTNYFQTFILVAQDSKAFEGTIPPEKNPRTVARMQYDMIHEKPYQFTSDEVIFSVFAERNSIPKERLETAREEFFSKGQPCLRSSPLTKTYGWGVHADEKGKVALVPVDSPEYLKFQNDENIKKHKAMASSR